MRRQPSIRLTPVLGLGLLVLGVVAYSRPEESRKAATEIATRSGIARAVSLKRTPTLTIGCVASVSTLPNAMFAGEV